MTVADPMIVTKLVFSSSSESQDPGKKIIMPLFVYPSLALKPNHQILMPIERNSSIFIAKFILV